MTSSHENADKKNNDTARNGGKPRDAAKDAADAVKDYLQAHPDLLHDEPDLLARLVPAEHQTGSGVVDFQMFTIDRLRQEIEDLRDLQQAFVNAQEENARVRDLIYDAVLKILDARNFEHLVHYITTELAADIEVDAVALGVEASESTRGLAGMRSPVAPGGPSVVVLGEGAIGELIGHDETGKPLNHVLRDGIYGARELFGARGDNIHSEALIRLTFSKAAPPGLLALGSVRANQFYPEQAVDNLEFLARVIERGVRLWLDLPPA